MKKYLLPLAIILVLATAYCFWQNSEPTEEPVPAEENYWVTRLNDPIPPDVDTSDWLTYRNEEFGFELKHPQEWIIEETFSETSDSPIVTLYAGGIEKKNGALRIAINLSGKFNERSQQDLIDTPLNITIGDTPAKQVGETLFLVIEKSGKIYFIDTFFFDSFAFTYPLYTENIEMILRSWSFLE